MMTVRSSSISRISWSQICSHFFRRGLERDCLEG